MIKAFWTTSLSVIIVIFFHVQLISQVIWSGPDVTFSKPNGVDWTLIINQDHLTSNVALTRANNKGLFNIITEASYVNFSSPSDTEWAYGSTTDLLNLTFADWETTHDDVKPMLSEDMVLHLISDDIYIDLQFNSWAGGMNGGFSYTRSSGSATLPAPVAVVPTLGQWAIIVLFELMLIVSILAFSRARLVAYQNENSG